ncbi:MAG TPA: hypothetical protein VFW87_05560, partial [Pirellulales bacterium]|nr:hypothetical protein [Pirellulales bacterium]
VLYGKATLTRILESYPWKAGHGAADLSWQAFRSIARNRSVLSVLLVMPFVLALATGGRRTNIAVAGSALAAVTIIALVTWNKKVPPERVYFPLMSFPLSVVLLSFAWRSDANLPAGAHGHVNHNIFRRASMFWQRAPRLTRVAVVLFAIGAVMGLYRQARQSVQVHRSRGHLLSFLNQLRPSQHKLYVSWEAALPYEWLSPLDNLDSWRVPLLSLAWTQRTPWHEEIKRQFGISNIAQAICQRDDIVLVATPLHRALFARFAKEHFQTEVKFVPLIKIESKRVAGHFQPRERLGKFPRNPTDRSRN